MSNDEIRKKPEFRTSKTIAIRLFGFRALSFFRYLSFVIRISKMVSVAGLAPARGELKIRLRELLCIHGRKKWSDGVLEFWSDGPEFRVSTPSLRHSITPLTARLARLVSEQWTEGRDNRDEPGIHEVLNYCFNVFLGGRSLFVEQV